MSNLDKESVKRVRKALNDAGLGDTITIIPESAHTAVEAAEALDVAPGAVAKIQVYTIGNRYVLAVIAGNHTCQEDHLPRALGMEGAVLRPTDDLVRAVTGFSIGGVSPIGLAAKLPVAIDGSLKKFEKIYVSGGYTHCVFETTVDELKQFTGGVVSYAIAKP